MENVWYEITNYSSLLLHCLYSLKAYVFYIIFGQFDIDSSRIISDKCSNNGIISRFYISCEVQYTCIEQLFTLSRTTSPPPVVVYWVTQIVGISVIQTDS